MWKYEEILIMQITFSFTLLSQRDRVGNTVCALTLLCLPVWTSIDDKTRVHINYLAMISPGDLGS